MSTIFDVLYEILSAKLEKWDRLKTRYKAIIALLVVLTLSLGLYFYNK